MDINGNRWFFVFVNKDVIEVFRCNFMNVWVNESDIVKIVDVWNGGVV